MPVTTISTEGWKPRCALRVGVVGNRRFEDEQNSMATPASRQTAHCVTATFEEVWRALFQAIDAALDYQLRVARDRQFRMRKLFSNELPRLAVLSSLAAGADQIGASVALRVAGEHQGIAVELEALLPFDESDYPGFPSARRSEFRSEEAKILWELAGQACQVVRLPGNYSSDMTRSQAYTQARDFLLQNSDLIIAVYDPRHTGRVGGTQETVSRALDSEIPVIAILLAHGEARVQVVHHETYDPQPITWTNAFTVASNGWRTSLHACVQEQLVLPESLAHQTIRGRHGADDLKNALFRLDLMGGSARTHMLCRNPVAAWIFGRTWDVLLGLARAMVGAKHANTPEQTTSSKITLEPFASVHRRASELAVDHIRTYRGAFVASYILAGVAVAAAVTLISVSLATKTVQESVIWGLCTLKIGVLLILILLERAGRKGRFQEAGADFRYLAEVLRPMQWLAPIGAYPLDVGLPLHAAREDPRRRWMGWLARAIARASPSIVLHGHDAVCRSPAAVSITAEDAATALDRARTQWVEAQIEYHRQASSRMHVLDDGLERLTRYLLWTVLAAAVTACFVEMRHPDEHSPMARTSVILSALAAMLPAWIATFAGIAFQSEASRLARRYDGMYEALELQRAALLATAEQIRFDGGADSRALTRASALLRKVSTVTITEASDWKVLYQAHAIRAG